jgi:hypothetical protein
MSGPYQPLRGDGPDGTDGKPGNYGFGDYHAGVDDDTHDAFGAAATAAEQRPTTGDGREPDSYVPGSYTYPTPHDGSRLGF